jgi:hypothetical protein
LRRPLDNDAGEALQHVAVNLVSRDGLGYRTTTSFKPRPPIHHISSRLHRGRPRSRQHFGWLRHRCVATTSSWCRSPPRLVLVEKRVAASAICAATRPIEKVPHAQPRALLKNGATVCGSKLGIATDVAGTLGSSEAPARTGHSFSLASAMGLMDKMPP